MPYNAKYVITNANLMKSQHTPLITPPLSTPQDSSSLR